jgi:capsular polysaccharide biosynthesis protein
MVGIRSPGDSGPGEPGGGRVNEQPLNLKRFLQILRQHWVSVGLVVMIGGLAGAGIAALKPPLYTENALVALSTSTRNMTTQTLIADSTPVLAQAALSLDPHMSPQALSRSIQVSNPIAFVLSISAQGKTANEVVKAANAVAKSYVAYVSGASSPGGPQIQARIVRYAVSASKASLLVPMLFDALIGALAGAMIGAIIVLAVYRNDRRLRQRDAIADAISVPVLASVPALHPAKAHQWARLLDQYEPTAADARRLRHALDYLGLTALMSGNISSADSSLTVLSLSSDRGALALGPQLAAFAAAQGIRTALVISGRGGDSTIAALRDACVTAPSPGRSKHLRVAVTKDGNRDWPDAALTIVVAVVNSRAPHVADTISTDAMVLAVSAGAATAQQLARVAASTADGRQIAGILVADPDPADPTTGRIPQLGRRTLMPTRITGTAVVTKR